MATTPDENQADDPPAAPNEHEATGEDETGAPTPSPDSPAPAGDEADAATGETPAVAGSGSTADPAPAKRRRLPLRKPRLRHLVPGLLIVAVLGLPTGLTVRNVVWGGDDRPRTEGVGSFRNRDRDFEDEEEADIDPFLDPEMLDAVPVGEDEVNADVEEVLAGPDVIEALDDSGIPDVARDAYGDAADWTEGTDPSCNLGWPLLAAIGRVESDHGRFGGAALKEDGYGTRPIRGIPLDGRPNIALIRDSDGGELDDDPTYDRAVGPMQFIPTTWRSVAADANGDGWRDPDNIYDAAQGAGRYLCEGNLDLSDTSQRAQAIRRYNNADEYVRVVMNMAVMYETGDIDAVEDLIDEAERTTDGWDDLSWPDAGGDGYEPEVSGPDPEPAPGPAPAPPAPGPAPAPPTTAPPAPQQPPAAVGWAPAMRVVVVDVIKERTTTTTTAPPTTAAPTTVPPTTAAPRSSTTVCPPRSTTTSTRPATTTTAPAGGPCQASPVPGAQPAVAAPNTTRR